jgi:hypothetical protein
MTRLPLCATLALGALFGCDLGGSSDHSTTPNANGGGCNGSPSGAGSGGTWGGSGGQPPPPNLIFETEVHRIARGATLRIDTIATPALDQWTITVDDPAVLQVTATNTVELEALAPGTTTIHARHGDRTVSYDLTVVAAAKLEVRLVQPLDRPGPTTHLTAIAGSTDFLELTYVDAAGGVLAGTGAAALTGEGGVTLADPGTGPLVAAFSSDRIRREYAAVAFGTGGRLIARGDFGTAVIDVAVVPRPAQVGIGLSLIWGGIRLGTITGQTAAGEPLAGMAAIWTVAPADHVAWFPKDEPAQQVLVLPDTSFHGHVAVTGQVDALTATAGFDVP